MRRCGTSPVSTALVPGRPNGLPEGCATHGLVRSTSGPWSQSLPRTGPRCEPVGDRLLHNLRAAQGIIGLADKHDHGRVDAACARAIAVGDPGYRTVKGILAAGTEHDGGGGVVERAAKTAAHLHGPTRLFDGLNGAAVGR